MSKQYLTVHTIDNAHQSQIFALATTPNGVFSASGGEAIKFHSAATDATGASSFSSSDIPKAHRSGCHHLAAGAGGPGKVLASAGFGHEVKVWVQQEGSGEWKEHGTVSPWGSGPSAAKVWAVALNSDEQFLACSSEAGKVAVWDIPAGRAVHLYETASEGQGSFGMSVDISPDGRLTASGHQNGTVYVFNNDSGRLVYSLTGLSKPIRSVKFSPGGTRLATAGDAGIIAIYDTQNGEHVSNLSPSGPSGPWIMSLDWSHTGEYLLSGSFDGRVRVWSIEAATCVATHSESDETIWAVKWLPKPAGNPRAAESFCAAGARGSITFYREASGS
ncbi:hypothetical protein MCOR27_005743 [Pyricularia oryzae]|uniref:Meiotic recombination protein rec14 n=3 Tax=Pyricularia TaxID=48558 RepID=A0ABQ8N2Q3_PYRGI|nr:meiotic recombination protein rec14 [Pyricularia oryzae 70-15]KAH8842411.1 hypothetical protein MCOR01_006318 [Pyricularia oryzae]KAI6290269.1 hypothetical protein MCOR33_011399 [Pyricularia grisea]EHA56827.1 meiotic recombination protein rec14 [Pyricularia oryzae 70-15]KAH9435654.1 hypothetical protein MCOR02_004575 [Pyricularia oryzae]KAI6259548.1 hypothetical protein MCOR19_004089 [Pyricularia oryzae]